MGCGRPKHSKPALGAACQLCHAKSFLFYWPETAGCSLQTLQCQTFRNLPNRLLELPIWAVAGHVFPFLLARNCRMLPSKASNPPKPSKPALGAACQLCHAKSFLFYWPETAGCSQLKPFNVKRSETCQTVSWSC